MQRPATVRSVAEDRTLYWTLSFYLPRSRIGQVPDGLQCASSLALSQAIDPLFNDIADRSRQQKVPDRLFCAGPAETLDFAMPRLVEWTTEGSAFAVPIEPERRNRDVSLRRFWYRYPDGAFSWNLGFEYRYGADLAAERAGTVPATYYFLSLLQKLAWPKEFDSARGLEGLDALVGLTVTRPISEAQAVPFWDFVAECYRVDRNRLKTDCAIKLPVFSEAVENVPSIEIPGLTVPANRSSFYFHDRQFFKLIEPVENGVLVKRRTRVPDAEFRQYPELIAQQKALQPSSPHVLLGADYWRSVRRLRSRPAETRLAYLFLAGFSQNIIDFTNQEASEVLDSLDPIYPKSDEQEEEGFFVRFANPRAMITFVPRSRTLEVGNDHIGTCPYAFLIHALSMHNEALTREQEEETFRAIDEIQAKIGNGSFAEAEAQINAVRRDAFEKYERHRYRNPFRYDTERDVFEELELLRGTSRLKEAYQGALAALEEDVRDLHRRQRDKDAEHSQTRERLLNLLFGILGVSGVIQVVFQVEQFAHDRASNWQNWTFAILSLIMPIAMALALPVAIAWYVRRRSR